MKDLEPLVHLSLLGGLKCTVTRDSKTETIRFATKKTALLFSYLSLYPDREINRELLATLFWPQSDSETGRRSLRDALRFLRQVLNEAGIAEETLRADRNYILLSSAPFKLDVAEFDGFLKRAKNAATSDDRLSALECAVGLYGGPFLAGYFDVEDAEEWIEPRRRYYGEQFEFALVTLARLLAGRGETERALEYARRAEEIVPNDPDLATLVRRLKEQYRLESRHVLSEPPEDTVHSIITDQTPSDKSADETNRSETQAQNEELEVPPATVPAKTRKLSRSIHLTYIGMALATIAVAAFSIHRPSKPLRTVEEGHLWDVNYFESPVAQNLDVADYQRLFGTYCAALEDAQTPEQRFQYAQKLFDLGLSAHYRDKGRGAVALMSLEKAREIFRELNSLSRVSRVDLAIADAALLRGERERALSHLSDASSATVAFSNPVELADHLLHIAELQIDLGEYESAQSNAEKSRNLCIAGKTNKERNAVAFAYRFLGVIARERCDFDRAREYLLRSAEMLSALGDRPTRAAVLGELGDLYLAQGYPDRALNLYEQGLQIWKSIPHSFWIARFKIRMGNAYFYLGRAKEALNCSDEAILLLNESNGPVAKAHYYLLMGKIRRSGGNLLTSQELLLSGLDIYRQTGNPRAIAETLECLAGTLRDLNNVDLKNEVIALLKEADALRKRARTPVPPIDRVYVSQLHRELGLRDISSE